MKGYKGFFFPINDIIKYDYPFVLESIVNSKVQSLRQQKKDHSSVELYLSTEEGVNKMSKYLSTKRSLSSYSAFKKALLTLQKAVLSEGESNEYLEDATIQRFEYTYEAAWKCIKFILEDNGVMLTYPSQAFIEAFSVGWISDAETGRDMIIARNSTSHNYNEEKASKIYADICNIYYPELKYLQLQLEGVINGNT